MIKNVIKFLIILALSAVCIHPPQSVQAREHTKPITSLTVVSDDNYPPYIFRDEKGTLQGILVDAWKLWEQRTGIRVKLVAMDWADALQFMKAGKADVIDTFFYTEERAKAFDFSKPYAVLDVPVFFHTQLSGIMGFKSLQGFTVGVKAGDACIGVLKKNGITNLREYRSYEAVVRAAVARHINVFAIDKPPALYYLHKMDLEDEFGHSFNLYTGNFHRGVKKGRADLLKVVEDGFSRITKQEEDAIEKKWQGTTLLKRAYVRAGLLALLFIGMVVFALVVFNRTLQRRIKSKTMELQEHVNKLRLNEEKYRELVENANSIILRRDAAGNVTFFNEFAQKFFGYTEKEILGKNVVGTIVPETESTGRDLKWMIEDIARNPDLYINNLNENICRNGDRKWITWTNKPVYDRNQNVAEILCIGNDVTERETAEKMLQLSEREKTILNEIANIFLTVSDEEMYAEVLTVVLREMKSPYGIFGFIDEQGNLAVPSLTRDVWHECRVSGKSIVFLSDTWGHSLWSRAIREKRTFCTDGPFHTPEGHVPIHRFLTVPVVFGEETIGVISVANKDDGYTTEDTILLERIASFVSPILHARLQRYIQERRRMAAEMGLKESEEKYRLLITNAGEAIFIVQDEFVKFPNPKALEMIGYSAEELAKIPFHKFIHPSDKDELMKGFTKNPEGERRAEAYRFRIINKSGKEIWGQLSTAPIVWDGKPGTLCFLSDVTKEKDMETRFMHAQRMEAVGRLAGGVAHDFNNKLMVIIGHTELALMNVAPSDPLHTHLREIDTAARRSADLTRQLLTFARKQTIAPRVIDLNDTVSGMLNMLRRLIGEDIDLAWIPEAEVWPVKMDPSQIDQVLANLCLNARDAIAGPGKVIVRTENITFDDAYCTGLAEVVPGDYVLLAVSDDGCGMDEETQVHLFEPFFTTKDIGLGTGLGLATVYGIVKQNQGFINLSSEPGQGTTFKLYFPRHKAGPAEILPRREVETPPGGRETVMIVEDEEALLEICEKILKELGYTVLIAGSPGEAIHLTEKHSGNIDLLITDVVMPEMNGRALVERLASIKPGFKCLYMSGYTADAISHQGILEKGVHFIQKPFSIKGLSAKVREVLDHKSTDEKGE
jgi:PAS domain S-box-containing protein